MKKTLVIFAILFCGLMLLSFTQITRAADNTTSYVPLSPITSPDGSTNNPVNTSNFPTYLSSIYHIGIGACFALGVIMFTWAGIEYVVSEAMGTKADAKNRMTNALIGLAIALVSYILLNTINPNLLIFKSLNITAPSGTSGTSGAGSSGSGSLGGGGGGY